MPFNVELRVAADRDQRVDRLVGVSLPLAVLVDLADRFPLLSGVDPYDDTFFNSIQMERQLIAELEDLATLVDDVERATIERIIALARSGAERPHHYLVFVGD